MSDEKTGGPAFPVVAESEMAHAAEFRGMTLRDYFAAKAMQGYVARSDWSPRDKTRLKELGFDGLISVYAYEMADAMLKARQQ